jgi:hypothetical protein
MCWRCSRLPFAKQTRDSTGARELAPYRPPRCVVLKSPAHPPNGLNPYRLLQVSPDLTPTQRTPYRYFRFVPRAATGVYISQLEFVGYTVSSVTDSQCPVSVTFTPGAASVFATSSPTVVTAAAKFVYSQVRPCFFCQPNHAAFPARMRL